MKLTSANPKPVSIVINEINIRDLYFHWEHFCFNFVELNIAFLLCESSEKYQKSHWSWDSLRQFETQEDWVENTKFIRSS